MDKRNDMDMTYALDRENRYMNYATRNAHLFKDKPDIKTNMRKYHKVSDHDFHISRFRHCFYCEAGSEPVVDCMLELSDSEIEERLAKKR